MNVMKEDLDAIPLSGSSFYCAAVVATTDSADPITDADVEMTACGSSCFSSAAADVATTADASANMSSTVKKSGFTALFPVVFSLFSAGVSGKSDILPALFFSEYILHLSHKHCCHQ